MGENNLLLLLVISIKKSMQPKYRLPILNWIAMKPNDVKGTMFSEIDDERLYDVSLSFLHSHFFLSTLLLSYMLFSRILVSAVWRPNIINYNYGDLSSRSLISISLKTFSRLEICHSWTRTSIPSVKLLQRKRSIRCWSQIA